MEFIQKVLPGADLVSLEKLYCGCVSVPAVAAVCMLNETCTQAAWQWGDNMIDELYAVFEKMKQLMPEGNTQVFLPAVSVYVSDPPNSYIYRTADIVTHIEFPEPTENDIKFRINVPGTTYDVTETIPKGTIMYRIKEPLPLGAHYWTRAFITGLDFKTPKAPILKGVLLGLKLREQLMQESEEWYHAAPRERKNFPVSVLEKDVVAAVHT